MSASFHRMLAAMGVLAMISVSPASGEVTVEALGELNGRIELTQRRIAEGGEPAFTRGFVLADVVLDPGYPRRFSEYSGDLSGRVFGAVALLPGEKGMAMVDALVKDALTYQCEDGRFGDPGLKYTAEEIERNHMALLWGNGRLLVGLLEYHSVNPDPAVLEASRRLGDFLMTVREGCSSDEVAGRIREFGAAGIICFTQLLEGLVMLADATGDPTYLEASEEIVPWLEGRGTQHSHGYLTTLRGMVMLYEATGKAELLSQVEQAYGELVVSGDYLVYGGVMEYFGGKGDRDEGCSVADFLRLSLQLWHATGESEYAERAERCLLNQFFANQFETGDFGHRMIIQQGFAPPPALGRAWWCCTMHGLRALRDVVDSIVREEEGMLKVDLFLDAAWASGDASGRVTRLSDRRMGFTFAFEKAPETELAMAIRKPGWAKGASLRVDGQAVEGVNEGAYVVVKRSWAAGEVLEVVFDASLRLETRDKKTLTLDAMGDGVVEAALWYGPYLLSAQLDSDPMFFGEPWTSNVVYVDEAVAPEVREGGKALFTVPGAHFRVPYLHSGFPDIATVNLRPISEYTLNDLGTVAVWLKYQRKP